MAGGEVLLHPLFATMSGILYIVATPIGNLEDITLRALRMLREADMIAAEDTRVTRKLLSHYEITTPQIAYHQHSTDGRAEEIVRMLEDGRNVALVSDAGTPGISDPGYDLIARCIARGIAVTSVPGPVAFMTALVLSGLPTAHLAFDGFPPRKDSERRTFFRSLKNDPRTVCLYESPLRLVKTLEAVRDELGDRPLAVVREATKMFEEIFRGTAAEAVEHFSAGKVRGEIVLVLGGASQEDAREAISAASLDDRLLELMGAGMSERDAVRQCVVEFRLPRREVYAAALRLKPRREE